MSIFYIAALVVASIFWLIVVLWLVKEKATKIKVALEKQQAADLLAREKIIKDDEAVTQSTAKTNNYQSDHLEQS